MDRLFDYFAIAVTIVIALVVFALGWTPAFLGGFAWGLLGVFVAGWLIQFYCLRDHGGGGIGESYVCLVLIILLCAGAVVGLLSRWAAA